MKILIVKISAIGDVVMALSMVDAVRRQDPDARVSWLCGKTVVPLLEAVGTVNEIITVDEAKLLTGNPLAKLKALIDVWKCLLGRSFDLIVTGHSDPRYRLLSLTASGERHISFGRDNGRLWPVPGRHHSDEYARLVTNVDGPAALYREGAKLAIQLPEELKTFLKVGESSIVALAPGGAKNVLSDNPQRRWPLDKYVLLAEKLLDMGVQVVVTGSPSDQWICEHFQGVDVLDFVGRTNLPELVGLYGMCDVVVTHDSGPLHLAGLAGAPAVALFGPTNPHEKVPRTSGTRILWGGEELACRPCYDGKTFAPCKNNLCLRGIDVNMVCDEVIDMLQGKGGK